MAGDTGIEWTMKTWNPIQGCTKYGPGCLNCYIFPIIARFGPSWGRPENDTGKVIAAPHKLLEPLRMSKSYDIFTNSMSDLFQVGVSELFIRAVCRAMQMASWHRYQVLTKRAERLQKLLKDEFSEFAHCPHIWWGVSVENRSHGLPRIDYLRDTPAVVKFLSVEPLLEDLGEINLSGIDWVIVGGESGPGARPMEADWVRNIREQCVAAGVKFFFKQWGGVRKKTTGRLLDGQTYDGIPEMPAGPVPTSRDRKALIALYEAEFGHLGLHRQSPPATAA